jgi:hypothetical protein
MEGGREEVSEGDGWLGESLNGWMEGGRYGWVDGWMDGWMDGR